MCTYENTFSILEWRILVSFRLKFLPRKWNTFPASSNALVLVTMMDLTLRSRQCCVMGRYIHWRQPYGIKIPISHTVNYNVVMLVILYNWQLILFLVVFVNVLIKLIPAGSRVNTVIRTCLIAGESSSDPGKVNKFIFLPARLRRVWSHAAWYKMCTRGSISRVKSTELEADHITSMWCRS
jgi:hypothetical protein